MNAYRKKGFLIGVFVFLMLLILPIPNGLNASAWSVAAVVTLMAIWWATEAIPVPVTALLPLALFPLLFVAN